MEKKKYCTFCGAENKAEDAKYSKEAVAYSNALYKVYSKQVVKEQDEELARLKENIGVFIENINSQEIIENAHHRDKQTGFYKNLYLYSTLISICSQIHFNKKGTPI